MYYFILQYLDSYKETMLSLLKMSTQIESQALQNDKKFGQVLFLQNSELKCCTFYNALKTK